MTIVIFRCVNAYYICSK